MLSAVRKAPRGRVATYRSAAALAGHLNTWRAVDTVLRNCRLTSVPCHRVVNSDSRVGRYSDPLVKRDLMQSEGVHIAKDRIKYFDQLRWPDLP